MMEALKKHEYHEGVKALRGEWPNVEELRGFKTWTQNPLGATNTFSRGKVDETDEGDLRLAVYHKDGTVFVNFGKPTAWIGMDADTARQVANSLNQHAQEVLMEHPEVIECTSEEGITIGLIDSIIASANALEHRDMSHPQVIEAIEDLRSNRCVQSLVLKMAGVSKQAVLDLYDSNLLEKAMLPMPARVSKQTES